MQAPSLLPLKRPEYKPDTLTRIAQASASRAEPNIRPLVSNTMPRGKWAYWQERG